MSISQPGRYDAELDVHGFGDRVEAGDGGEVAVGLVVVAARPDRADGVDDVPQMMVPGNNLLCG